MSLSLYRAWSQGQVPLRSVLGTPDACFEHILPLARRAEEHGDWGLAETILRGVLALDPGLSLAAESLARVLLSQALATNDPHKLRDATAWADYAVALGSPSAAALRERCARSAR